MPAGVQFGDTKVGYRAVWHLPFQRVDHVELYPGLGTISANNAETYHASTKWPKGRTAPLAWQFRLSKVLQQAQLTPTPALRERCGPLLAFQCSILLFRTYERVIFWHGQAFRSIEPIGETFLRYLHFCFGHGPAK